MTAARTCAEAAGSSWAAKTGGALTIGPPGTRHLAAEHGGGCGSVQRYRTLLGAHSLFTSASRCQHLRPADKGEQGDVSDWWR